MAETLPTFNAKTTAAEAALVLAPWIKDRTILVTRTSIGGIGFETARVIACAEPRLLILAGRSVANNMAAEKAIKEEAPDANIRLLTLDLGSFTAVRAAVVELDAWKDVTKLDILINNAAIMGGPYQRSIDGIEGNFATNHLGTFLLTNLFLPKIIAAGPGSRIVNVSSRAHFYADISYDNWNWNDGATYNPTLAYGMSKTGNILFATSLAVRLAPKSITAFSVHPGAIPTNLSRSTTEEEWAVHRKNGLVDEHNKPIIENSWFAWKTIAEGAGTSVVAAFDPRIQDKSGGYLVNCAVTRDPEEVKAYALDGTNAQRLWILSETLVKEKFTW
jgi:NAD(P)-dependent dehydrogenase (short-subunit alcohol dehydrogenase family)